MKKETKLGVLLLSTAGTIALGSFILGAACMEYNMQEDVKEDVLYALNCSIARDGVTCNDEDIEAELAELTGIEEADGGIE